MAPPPPAAAAERGLVEEALATLGPAYRVLALKAYRLPSLASSGSPLIPCLDHEAKLHASTPRHASAYVEEVATGDLHEVLFEPSRSRIRLDLVSTAGEHDDASVERLRDHLRAAHPRCKVSLHGPSLLRGDLRVTEACRAQVSIREVLRSTDIGTAAYKVGRLRVIAGLMEKESRVASWSVRTVTTPVLAALGVIAYLLAGALQPDIGADGAFMLRYAVLTVFGALFVYFGLKAVHLTEMANRVWKRAAEYDFILEERRRLAAGDQRPSPATDA